MHAHSGVYAAQGPRQFHRVKWTFPTGNRIVSSPVLRDKVIYFGSDDGNVYAVDAADGHQRLEVRDRAVRCRRAPRSPATTVYVVSYDGNFYALNARTGALRWKFATGGRAPLRGEGPARHDSRRPDLLRSRSTSTCRARSSPAAPSTSAAGDGNLYALDAASGEFKWKFATGDVVHASPAYADGVLYVGSWDSYLYAVDARTGKEKWRFHGGEDALIHNQVGFQSSPAVAERRRLHGLPRLQPLRDRRGHRQGEVALQQRRAAG